MTEKKNAAVVVGVPAEIAAYEKRQASVELMITKAIESGMPVETMKEILAMRTALKAEWAKEQFDRAMASCQAEIPVIVKNKEGGKTKSGMTAYMYAPLDAIVTVAGPIIARHGFSYSFKTENDPTRVKVTCIVKHRDGHSEESTMETALGERTQIMSAPQQIAATVTFNKRYAFTNAFGITTGGEDDESQLQNETLDTSAPPLGTIRVMIADAKLDEAAVAAKCKVATLEDLDERGRKMLEKSLLIKLGSGYIPTINA